MKIDNVINRNLIDLNLESNSKKEILTKLVNMLYENNRITHVKSFLDDLYSREELGTTYIGNFVAIPHGKSIVVKQVSIAIGIISSPIDWNEYELSKVRYILLFAIPDIEGTPDFFTLLSQVIELFITPFFLHQLSKVQTPNALLQLLKKNEFFKKY